MKRNTLFLILMLIASSCVFIRMDDSIDLGSNYRYIQDFPQTIIYHKTDKYEGIGLNAVPPIVTDYEFNSKYIIAKNKDWENDEIGYWIIDKDKPFSEIEPLDSVSFFTTFNQERIGLDLKRNTNANTR